MLFKPKFILKAEEVLPYFNEKSDDFLIDNRLTTYPDGGIDTDILDIIFVIPCKNIFGRKIYICNFFTRESVVQPFQAFRGRSSNIELAIYKAVWSAGGDLK